MRNIEWRNRRVVICFHEATSGLSYDLRDYLLEQGVAELLFIAHPLLYLPENFKNTSRYELYKNGKLVRKHTAIHWKAPESILYIKDTFYSIIWSLRFGVSADIYIGVGNLNAFSGLLLKRVKMIKKVVYYVIDYVPQRFTNSFLNDVYHRIEKVCAEGSDATWNLSPRMIDGREQKWRKKFANQLVVPHGVHLERIQRVPFSKSNKTEILYMGTLLKKQGIQLVINALPKLLKKIPNITLTIIGKGPYEDELRKQVSHYKLQKHVHFLGYIADHKEMENRVAKASIAIALYDKKYDQFSYYADPGKIKSYLGAGVPVLMTDVPYVVRQVEEAQCGFITEYSEKGIYNVLLKYFSEVKRMEQYRKNAIAFAKQYKWDDIFDKAFEAVYN